MTTAPPTPATRPILLLLLVGLLMAVVGCDSAATEDPPPTPADTTPPQVVRVDVFDATRLTVVFNEALDPASVSPGAFEISNGVGAPASAAYLSASTSVELTVGAPLAAGNYTVRVTGVRDAAGNTVSGAQASFPVTDAGGGGGDEEEVAVGAAYPNAADGRIILINAEGDRYVLWNPTNGSFSSARSVSTLENGALPFGRLGAAVSTAGNTETYFFDAAGETYAVYERDEAEFDETEEFGEDDTDFMDADIEEVSAAYATTAQFFLFDRQGTSYQVWNYANETWSQVFSFVSDFGGGGTPISAVGAAITVDGVVYLFNRDGTEYTIYNDSNRSFSDDFDIDELGDGTLSFE